MNTSRLALVLVLLTACSSSTGDVREPCYGNDTCNPGLVCLSNVCVALSDGAGADAATDGDARGRGDASSADAVDGAHADAAVDIPFAGDVPDGCPYRDGYPCTNDLCALTPDRFPDADPVSCCFVFSFSPFPSGAVCAQLIEESAYCQAAHFCVCVPPPPGTPDAGWTSLACAPVM